MSLQLLENDLSLDNDSFSQELDVISTDRFEMRRKLRNSTRGKSKKLSSFDKRIKKHRSQIKKIMTQKRSYMRKRA